MAKDRRADRLDALRSFDGEGVDARNAGHTDRPDRPATTTGDNYLEPRKRRISRRQALGIFGGGGAIGLGLLAGREILLDPAGQRRRPHHQHTPEHGAAAPAHTPPTTEPPPPPALWSDPATWGGAVPGPGDVAVVEGPVILDIDTQVAGVQIRPAGQLIYDPAVSHTLASTGNVVVEGTLSMRPDNPAVQQVLSFAGINEANYVGGHTDQPLDSDVGVWVIGAGMLDLVGTQKTAWTHLAAEAPAGAATITVDDATGWQVFDEVVITPTEPATVDGHWQHHDRRLVTAVAGNQVTLDRPIDFPHPFVPVRQGVTHRAEVLNVGRNVRIEGAADARAHVILLHAHMPQTMGWVGLRHLGPRQGGDGVLGRYAMHFHMCDDGVRGSTLDGMVSVDGGNHAFVVHLSNGVSLRDCVAHDNTDDPFWWDLNVDSAHPDSVPSHDVLYERCVANFVRGGAEPHTVSGFLIGAGSGNVARGCVASGVDGDALSACGFLWSQNSTSEHAWVFEDNLTHNNSFSGIYYWQNNAPHTVIERFTVYHGKFGIWAGAYTNAVSYRDCDIYACTEGGLLIEATSGGGSADQAVTYQGMHVDQAGLSEFAVEISDPALEGAGATTISNCVFKGGTTAQVQVEGGQNRHWYDFQDCTFEGNAFWIDEGVREDSEIRVIDGVNGSVLLHPAGSGGSGRPEWNATITSG